MNKKAAWIVIVSAIAVLTSGVEGTTRTCYFGPPPKPDPENPDHWMKQVMREIRERCPGKGACSQAERVECANPRPLGMEDGSIPDANISASSMYGGWPPQAARLNGDSAWSTATMNGSNQWIEVDLGERTVVSGVITQGDPGGDWWMTKYKVSYQKQPSSERTHVKDRNGNIVSGVSLL
ncbi:retinoschisin-like isoform X2 [Acanthaster planci]|uniref:Retinoschisin-like isoform X2 n=1 Tax=Acanthaster planci TaxID=133434 RepID=A0A8B7XU17_ACAPL|nr:retinoschisin-like isoform X2 [Acanthaster planci]